MGNHDVLHDHLPVLHLSFLVALQLVIHCPEEAVAIHSDLDYLKPNGVQLRREL